MGDKKALIPTEVIVTKILFLRGEKVLLDRDMAELYGVETRVLNQAVTRNKKRFPEDFMFVLTRAEITRISQSVTSSKIKYSKRVTAFTENRLRNLTFSATANYSVGAAFQSRYERPLWLLLFQRINDLTI